MRWRGIERFKGRKKEMKREIEVEVEKSQSERGERE